MKNLKLQLAIFSAVLFFSACSKDEGGEKGGGGGGEAVRTTELKITPETVSTGYMGNGVEYGLYEHCFDANSDWGKAFGMWMDEAMWEKTFKRLDYMKLSLARTMITSKSFCYTGNDNGGNPVIDNTRNLAVAEKWLDYCDSRDVTLLWGEWGTGTIASVTDPKWSRTVIGYADYLINTRGHDCIRYFIPTNEPDGNWSDATGGNFLTWKQAAENVFDEIDSRGLGDRLQIAGPDACPDITGPTFIAMAATQLKEKIGLWNIHIYPYPSDIRNGNYESMIRQWRGIMGTDKKLVLGELGIKYQPGTEEYAENIRRAQEDPMGKTDATGSSNMFVYDFSYAIDIADLYIQCMRGGISGACAWMVCDAMNTSAGQKMKRWGMWNIFGTKMGNVADEDIRPWFYTLSLLSRYIPEGSDILTVNASGVAGVRAVAARKEGEITLAVVNNSGKDQRIRFSMEGEHSRTMQVFHCMENDRPADSDQLPVPKETREVNLASGEEFDLPASSFILLTSHNF